MKNKIFIFSAILLVAVTTITIVSCKKDNEKSNNTENLVKSHELSDMDKTMIAFGERMKAAANERSGETMPLAEALNTLTNYQNFTMCDASNYSAEMLTDTFKITMNVSEGEVLLSELNRVYETTRPEILSRFNVLIGEDKAIYCIRTIASEDSMESLDDYSGTLGINVVTRMLESPFSNEYGASDFGPSAYWYDFQYRGQCDLYEGQCVGRDCVTELKAKLQARMSLLGCGPGYSAYFTNHETITIFSSDCPDTSSPNGRYALPWRSFWDNEQCVDPEGMNYYLHAIEAVFDSCEYWNFKHLVDFDMREVLLPRDENRCYNVQLDITLADVNCVPDIYE